MRFACRSRSRSVVKNMNALSLKGSFSFVRAQDRLPAPLPSPLLSPSPGDASLLTSSGKGFSEHEK